MNFWEQFALSQATAALHVVIRKYGTKYFSPEELTAVDTTVEALVDLPRRIVEKPHA